MQGHVNVNQRIMSWKCSTKTLGSQSPRKPSWCLLIFGPEELDISNAELPEHFAGAAKIGISWGHPQLGEIPFGEGLETTCKDFAIILTQFVSFFSPCAGEASKGSWSSRSKATSRFDGVSAGRRGQNHPIATVVLCDRYHSVHAAEGEYDYNFWMVQVYFKKPIKSNMM